MYKVNKLYGYTVAEAKYMVRKNGKPRKTKRETPIETENLNTLTYDPRGNWRPSNKQGKRKKLKMAINAKLLQRERMNSGSESKTPYTNK